MSQTNWLLLIAMLSSRHSAQQVAPLVAHPDAADATTLVASGRRSPEIYPHS